MKRRKLTWVLSWSDSVVSKRKAYRNCCMLSDSILCFVLINSVLFNLFKVLFVICVLLLFCFDIATTVGA